MYIKLEANLIFILLLAFLLSALIMVASMLLSYKNPGREKLTSYECGFNPFRHANENPFSIQFVMVAILFLIFGLEIIYLIPYVIGFKLLPWAAVPNIIIFGLFLGGGIVWEWTQGGLEWK